MKNVWPWILGIAFGLILFAQIAAGRSARHAYWVARGSVARPVQVAQVEGITLIRYPCYPHRGSIETAKACGFYVWKK